MRGKQQDLMLFNVILLNLAFLICRFQNDLVVLSKTFMTVLLFAICFCLWLTKLKSGISRQVSIMLGLLIFHAILIIVGKVIYEPLILNDRHAYGIWSQLVQDFCCFLFPTAAFLISGTSFTKLRNLCVLAGIYLGAYAITHGGRGPGGYLWDENDNCMMLITLFPFAVCKLIDDRAIFGKLIAAASIFLLLSGIVATLSRGGMIGFCVTLALLFWNSPRKLSILLASSLAILAMLPFVPQKFWDEARSISTDAESDTGTGRERLDSWMVATRMWLNPKNNLQGVGFSNAPWHIRYYENDDRGVTKKSLAGRRLHSMWFQLLSETGTIGICAVLYLFFLSYRQNKTAIKQGKSLDKRIHRTLLELSRSSYQNKLEALDNNQEEQEINLKNFKNDSQVLRQAAEEIKRVSSLALAINGGLVAVASAGAFVSVAYYPPHWFLFVLSGSLAYYWKQLYGTIDEVLVSLK